MRKVKILALIAGLLFVSLSIAFAQASVNSFNTNTFTYNDSFNITQTVNYGFAKPGSKSIGLLAGNSDCGLIDVKTNGIKVREGQSVLERFSIKNNSSQVFYVSSIDAFDNSPYFSIEETSESLSINSFGTASFAVRASAGNVAVDLFDSGFVKVSGFFADSTYCTEASIGRESFTVMIDAVEEEQASCTDFKLLTPERITLKKGESKEVSFAVLNPARKTGYIVLHSDSAIVMPESIAIPAASSFNAVVVVGNLEKEKAWLFYDIVLGSCEIPSKVSLLELEKEEIPETIPIQVIPERVSIDSIVKPNIVDGSFEIEVIVSNDSEFPVSGSIEAVMPEEWKVSGETSLQLKPKESKTVKLKVLPDKLNTVERQGVIYFHSDSGRHYFQAITFQPNSSNLAAAMIVLGGNLFWIGLLILVIVFFLAVYYAAKSHKEKVALIKKNWSKAKHVEPVEAETAEAEAAEIEEGRKVQKVPVSFEDWLEENFETL